MAPAVRIVMTLLTRDEADVVDAHLRYHLAAGVDAFVVTDHASSDGTVDILERYVQTGVVQLLHETGDVFRQSEWVTRMARLAAAEHGAHWVVNSDADEFWWPAGGDLKDVLARVPPRAGVVRTFVRPFLARPGGGAFAERMTVRLAPPAAINDPVSSFKVNVRLVHRAAPDVVVGRGNASVRTHTLTLFAGRCPIEVLHFPIRGFDHYRRKFLDHYRTVGGRRGDHARAYEADRAGTLRSLYRLMCVDDAMLRRGLAAGVLVEDNRLREALRRLDAGCPLTFPRWELPEEAGYAVDLDALEHGEVARLQRRVDELAPRVAALSRRGEQPAARIDRGRA